MATKQPRDRTPAVKKSRAVAEIKPRENAAELPASRSFALKEFTVISISAKRLIPPRLAKRGRFEIKAQTKINPYKASDDGLVPGLRVALNFSITGFALNRDEDGNDVVGEKSFSIEAEFESRFQVAGKLSMDETPTTQEMTLMMAHIYPLAASKVQHYAADLGYRTVAPDLNISPDAIQIETETQ